MDELQRVEVNGATGRAVLRGFGTFTLVASRYLVEAGLGREGGDGLVELEPGAWYPLQTWLGVMQRISTEFGHPVVFRIGHSLVETGPAGAVDLASALRRLDGAYHRNHRLEGRVMWDQERDEAVEGIGGYACETLAPRLARALCDNPYPCAFDHGMLTALARKFEPHASVTHEEGACRAYGASHCTYRIRWRTEETGP